MTRRSPPWTKFTLAGLLIFVTLAALALGLGRWIGYVSAICLLSFPVPPAAYLTLIRYGMNESQADYQSRSRVVNWLLVGGLAFSLFLSLLLLSIGVDSFRARYDRSEFFIDPLSGVKG
jgi:hypothetical protein